MNTMDSPRVEKRETLKDIIESMHDINNEMDAQLQMIADALMNGSYPTNNDKNPENPLTIMDSIRCEREKAEKNLKLLVMIRECLW